MRYVTWWNDLPLPGWGPWGYGEPAAAWTLPGEEPRSPPDFLLESSSHSGRQQSPPLPALDLEVGAGGMLAPSLEALLEFAAPGRTSQGGAATWGFSGAQSACMQSPLGAALTLHLLRLISPGKTLAQ